MSGGGVGSTNNTNGATQTPTQGGFGTPPQQGGMAQAGGMGGMQAPNGGGFPQQGMGGGFGQPPQTSPMPPQQNSSVGYQSLPQQGGFGQPGNMQYTDPFAGTPYAGTGGPGAMPPGFSPLQGLMGNVGGGFGQQPGGALQASLSGQQPGGALQASLSGQQPQVQQQLPFGMNQQQFGDFQQKRQDFENQTNAAVQANPAFAQREQLIKQFGNNQPTPEQMQQLDKLSNQINSDPAVQQVRNAQQQYMQQYQQPQYQPGQQQAFQQVMQQVNHGGEQVDPRIQAQSLGISGNGVTQPTAPQMPQQAPAAPQLTRAQQKQQGPLQVAPAPTARQIGTPAQQQQLQRALQQFRPGQK